MTEADDDAPLAPAEDVGKGAGVLTTVILVDYIADMLDELCIMASHVGRRDLSWLLSLAREEASLLRRLTSGDQVTHPSAGHPGRPRGG